jgi:hypothetical protein
MCIFFVKKCSKEKRTKKKGMFQQPEQAISRINDGPCARGAVFMPRNSLRAATFAAALFVFFSLESWLILKVISITWSPIN